jgi:hypothetical protein
MKKILFALLACMMVLSIMVTPVSAATIWSEFEGVASKVDNLPGGEEWFSKDFTKLFARDVGELWVVDVDDARLDGELTFIFSANLKVTDEPVFIYGRMWGRMNLENDEGYWEGLWTGERTEQGDNYGFSVLHGHGDYEGMIAHVYWAREAANGLYAPMTVYGVIK